MAPETRLVVFLYRLLRDHLPSGEVEKIMLDCEGIVSAYPCFSDSHTEAKARDVARRLIGPAGSLSICGKTVKRHNTTYLCRRIPGHDLKEPHDDGVGTTWTDGTTELRR
jgi:hypothetical protein